MPSTWGNAKASGKKIKNIGWLPMAELWGLEGTKIPITCLIVEINNSIPKMKET